jgi:uncharacterized protein
LTIVVDAGPLFSFTDRQDPDHVAVRAVVEAERGQLVVPAFVVTETDYLIRTRLGIDVELALLQDLSEGAFALECLTEAELEQATEVLRRYRDLDLGVADASVVVLAARFRTLRLLTFDERHFRTVRPLQGGDFTLLPADA